MATRPVSKDLNQKKHIHLPRFPARSKPLDAEYIPLCEYSDIHNKINEHASYEMAGARAL